MRLGRRASEPPEPTVLELHAVAPAPPGPEALRDARFRRLLDAFWSECARRELDSHTCDDIAVKLTEKTRKLFGDELAGLDWTRVDRFAYTAVKNELYTRWKKGEGPTELPEEDTRPAPKSESTDPESFVLVAEIAQLADAEIRRWSDARRLPYLMVRSGMLYAEVAEALKISVHTVSRQVTEAHNALRIVLRDYDPPGSSRKPTSTRRD